MTVIDLKPSFKTVSGRPLLLGTGSGTKWKDMKRADASKAKLVEDQIVLSLSKGFYHVDCAEYYTTDIEVGNAIRRQNIDREDIWITHKYGPFSTTSGPVAAVTEALKNLKTTYVDAYLIHVNKFDNAPNGLTLETAWEQMIEVKKKGLARYIGVSNFAVDALETCLKISAKHGEEYYPKLNQIEYHPYLQNQRPGVYDFCQKNDILIEAYGPLSPLSRLEDDKHPLVEILAKLTKKYNRTDAQILLRWTLQTNVLPITTSSNETRIKQSLEVFDFALDPEDVELISGTGYDHRAFDFIN